MKKLYIVDLEYIESRYTAQWKTELPKYLRDKLKTYEVVVIDGNDVPQMTTPGAFLNFGGTTVYKAQQIEKIGRMFCSDQIQEGDEFLFTDFWHPGIIFVKYMSTLLNKKVITHGLIHAGSYDPHDFLGRVEPNKWLRQTEMAMFESFDHVYFATFFHYTLFCETYGEDIFRMKSKVRFTGWPFDFMKDKIEKDIYHISEKKNIVVFPHRLAPEKQHWTFLRLKEALLTKKEYHELLGSAKVVWSAALQETLGISTCIEGPLAGCIPICPNSLSYAEIFRGRPFVYNAAFVSSEQSFEDNIPFFKTLIQSCMYDYPLWKKSIDLYVEERLHLYSSFDSFVDYLE